MYNYNELEDEQLEYIPVATTEEIKPGERMLMEIDGEPVAVFNIGGKYFAIKDVCSHDDGPVAEGPLDGHQIECPRHGARFDIRNGKVLTLPAVVDIPAYPVRVVGDEIELGWPLDG